MRRLFLVSLFLLVVALMVLPTAIGRFLGRPTAQPPRQGADRLHVKVFFPETRQIREIALGEYLKGVVAAEMPAAFQDEALKAQFVVARTYVVRRMRQFNGGRGGCPLEPLADVCADPNTGQAYITLEETKERIGANTAVLYWKRLEQALAATAGLVVLHNGELIDPLYHSVSGTMTEDAAEYFGRSLPYLKPVDDRWGKDSTKLYDTRRYTPEQFARLVSGPKAAVTAAAMREMVQNGQVPVTVREKTVTGRVRSVKVGSMELSGREFRERLGIRSTNFTAAVDNGQIVVQTVGYGHGLGMSQYGANGMAKAGKDFREILHHYYHGIDIRRLFDG